ncbi:hypothetical protein C4D60_Mb11t10890 [Musa balbisiana]|uniref:Disease resistance protein winged helix domain-containing protein n=1 Tax=Musa balbisiana TaxID=52838 RepID=A0A4S8J3A8_MUSBA|nr:hypothetical protein C4D60_Mb11t10890 [Musa balbisiana]
MAFLTRWRAGMGGDEGSSDGVGTEVEAMEAETAARGAPQGERRATAAPIRLWIAESFVRDRTTQTMEEVAEEFLNELIHWSMLHIVERNSFGRPQKKILVPCGKIQNKHIWAMNLGNCQFTTVPLTAS